MFYFACAIVAGWVCGLLVLLTKVMNALRTTLNNLAPGANYWGRDYDAFRKGYYVSRIDPALFNEAGQKYLKRLILYGNFMSAWLIVGVILAVSLSSFFIT